MDSKSEKTFWNSKPYWCQPWTIVSFGLSIIIISWKLFSNIILTLVISLVIVSWWIVFLILAPREYKDISK